MKESKKKSITASISLENSTNDGETNSALGSGAFNIARRNDSKTGFRDSDQGRVFSDVTYLYYNHGVCLHTGTLWQSGYSDDIEIQIPHNKLYSTEEIELQNTIGQGTL